MFNRKFLKQIISVSIGSTLGQVLVDIIMCSFQNKWLKNCPYDMKLVFY